LAWSRSAGIESTGLARSRIIRYLSRHMLRFSIFGIPVQVQPFFWVVVALLGGAMGAKTPDAIYAVLLFMAAAFFSILIHELGHATVGVRLGGGSASILLTTFGGLAYNHGGRFNRQQHFWMIFAGPGAGFVFLALILGALSLFFNDADVLSLTSSVLFGTAPEFQTAELLGFLREYPFAFLLVRHLIWINFWWGIINLLPIMPLDGGQIANLFIHPQRRVFLVGAVAAAAMALLGWFWLSSGYTALLFGFLAWQNYQNMRQLNWQ
jgi:stage IV sporulation protein FB